MEQKCKKMIVIAGLWFGMAITANAEPKDSSQKKPVSEEDVVGAKAIDPAASESYWTPEKMANAKPMPTPLVIVDELSLANRPLAEGEESAEPAVPGFIQGCPPNKSDCNPKERILSSNSQDEIFPLSSAPGDLIQPVHGSKPTNPLNGPYGPFQRWREATPLTAFPKSTIGKLFFTLNGQNFVCSASAIGRSTLITAGHCNSDGAGNFATNRLFCPSFDGGVLQFTRQRLWLLTPLTQLLPGSVAMDPSVSAVSANPPVQPRTQGPPLEPPVKSLPMILEIWPPDTKSWVYQSVEAVV